MKEFNDHNNPHNIIIDDLEAAGLELMEYRGEEYIYFIYNEDAKEYLTHVYGDLSIYIKNMIEAEVNRNKT